MQLQKLLFMYYFFVIYRTLYLLLDKAVVCLLSYSCVEIFFPVQCSLLPKYLYNVAVGHNVLMVFLNTQRGKRFDILYFR